MDRVEVESQEGRGGYRRSARSARGEARRRGLLESVAADLASNGLVGFSLRRAARAAGTTHKVLLYHSMEWMTLLVQGVLRLRQQRVSDGLAAAAQADTLADRVRAIWPVLVADEAIVLDQAIGLAMYDATRYAVLGQDASDQYMRALVGLRPHSWPEDRQRELENIARIAARGASVADGVASVTRALPPLAEPRGRQQPGEATHCDGLAGMVVVVALAGLGRGSC